MRRRKCSGTPSRDRLRSVKRSWLRIAAIVLAGAVLGVVAGCGGDGDEEVSQEEFGTELQRAVEEPRAAFAQLAKEGEKLKPSDLLSTELKAEIGSVGETMGEAADELEQMDPPEGAEEDVQALIDALNDRADGFQQAAAEDRITLREFAPTLRESGARVDQAIAALRAAGYLP